MLIIFLINFFKQLFEIKFDFIRTICNHEHFISFSLPIGKGISNLNQFAGKFT